MSRRKVRLKRLSRKGPGFAKPKKTRRRTYDGGLPSGIADAIVLGLISGAASRIMSSLLDGKLSCALPGDVPDAEDPMYCGFGDDTPLDAEEI